MLPPTARFRTGGKLRVECLVSDYAGDLDAVATVVKSGLDVTGDARPSWSTFGVSTLWETPQAHSFKAKESERP